MYLYVCVKGGWEFLQIYIYRIYVLSMKSFLKDDNRQKSDTIILYPDNQPGRLYHLFLIDTL